MKQKLVFFKSLTDFYLWIELIILILSLSFLLNDSLTIGIPWFGILFGGVFWIMLVRFVKENYRNPLTYLIFFGLLLFLFLLLRIMRESFLVLVLKTIEFGFGSYTGENTIWVASLLGIFTTFCFSIFGYLVFRLFLFRMSVAAVYVILLPLFSILQINLAKITLFFMFAFILINLSIVLEWLNHKKQDTAMFLLPFLCLICLLIVLLPVQKEPIRWTFVRSVVSSVTDLADEMWSNLKLGFGDSGSYNLAFAGYSESGDIKGRVLESDQIAMNVNGKRSRQNVYLIGSVYDTYELDGWTKSSESYLTEDEMELDLFETYNLLYQSGYSKEQVEKFMITHTLDLIYQNLKTKTVFYPLKTYALIFPDKFKTDNLGTEIMFEKIYRKGLNYKTKFILLDYEQEDMVRLLVNPIPSYGSFEEVTDYMETVFQTASISMLGDINGDNIIERLENRDRKIHDVYTMLPDGISPKVKELAIEITKNYKTEYEKAKAIEMYLNQFPYTRNPQIPEQGKEVTEFLLFSSKEGYCTYFATSMAVMLRLLEIPTRYVEGFYFDYQVVNGYQTYEIPSKNAHAWCEVYIAGVGWIPFEPTGANRETRYQVREDGSNLVNKSPSYDYRPSEISPVITDDKQLVENSKTYYWILWMMLYLCLFILASALFYICLIKILKERRYEKASAKGKSFYVFLQIFKVLELKTGNKLQNETSVSIFQMLQETFELSMDGITNLQSSYLKVRYGNAEPDKEEIEYFLLYKNIIEQYYLNDKNMLQKLYYIVFQKII